MRRIAVAVAAVLLLAVSAARAGEAEDRKLIEGLTRVVMDLRVEVRQLRNQVKELKAEVEKLKAGAPARPSAQHVKAVARLRAYCSAQCMFKRNDWDQNMTLEYSPDLKVLSNQLDGNGTPIRLVPATMAAAVGATGKPWDGYLFKDMASIGRTKIDWINDYACCATPAKYGGETRLTFIVCTNGTVFCKDLGKSQFVLDYPADPAAAGWKMAQ